MKISLELDQNIQEFILVCYKKEGVWCLEKQCKTKEEAMIATAKMKAKKSNQSLSDADFSVIPCTITLSI